MSICEETNVKKAWRSCVGRRGSQQKGFTSIPLTSDSTHQVKRCPSTHSHVIAALWFQAPVTEPWLFARRLQCVPSPGRSVGGQIVTKSQRIIQVITVNIHRGAIDRQTLRSTRWLHNACGDEWIMHPPTPESTTADHLLCKAEVGEQQRLSLRCTKWT